MTTFPERLGAHPADPSQSDRPGDDAGMALTPTEEHTNVNGGVHGGILATMLDTVMGEAVRSDLPEDKSAVTVSLTVTFLDGAKVGEELVASAEVRKRGKSLVMVEGDIVRADDESPVAHGVATFSVIDAKD